MAVFLLLVTILLSVSSEAKDFAITFKIGAGRQECFYEPLKSGMSVEVEYQVIEGGELDITFYLLSPNHEMLVKEERKMDGLHSLDVSEDGDYSLCFDNSFSHISDKTIFMDVLMDSNSEYEDLGDEIMMDPDTIVNDMKVLDIRRLLANVTEHLNKVEFYQQFFRAREARHRHTLESSNSRVLWWSLFYCVLLIVVGVSQVMVLRRLFRNRRQDKITT